MFDVNIRWESSVVEALVDAGYDAWSIEREDPGPTWTQIVPVHISPKPYRYMNVYVFKTTTSDVASLPNIRVRAYRTSDATYDVTEYVATVSLGGYCTIQNVRDDGWDASVYSDEKVQLAIHGASAAIDRMTRQWFEPRYLRSVFNGAKIDKIFMQVPLIAVSSIEIDGIEQDLTSFLIYNRHLTHGITNPDDRADPHIAWGEGREHVDIRRLYGAARFDKARKSVSVFGISGYTELGVGDYAGETVPDSQIPYSYGSTPIMIARAALKLAIMYMQTFEDADEAIMRRRIISEKTRDQSYTLASPSSSESGFGISGDTEVDQIISMYQAPLDLGVV